MSEGAKEIWVYEGVIYYRRPGPDDQDLEISHYTRSDLAFPKDVAEELVWAVTFLATTEGTNWKKCNWCHQVGPNPGEIEHVEDCKLAAATAKAEAALQEQANGG